MKEPKVKISVIVPVYNAEDYLNKCLESIIAQSYYYWEAFIIDDASTDSSFSLISHYVEKDKRVNALQNKSNLGPGPTRNAAIEYVLDKNSTNNGNETINYIVFIDSDDWVEQTYFQSIVNVIEKKGSDVIFVDVVQEDKQGNFLKYERMSKYRDQLKDTIIKHQLTGKMPWGGVRKVVKAELLNDKEIRYSVDSNGEEALYSFKLIYSAESIDFVSEALYHYVVHANSQSTKYNDDPYGAICIKIEQYLKEKGLYNKYKEALFSFAFTALIVSIYRKTQYYNFRDSLKKSKKALVNFRQNYGFELDKDCLEPRVHSVLIIAKLNMILPIVAISKFKQVISERRLKC